MSLSKMSSKEEQTFYEQQDIETTLKKPSMCDVVMYDDDYTTMDFVVMVLIKIFRKSPHDAESIMLAIHNSGQRVVGTYVKDIALSKKAAVDKLSDLNGFPLLVTVEERED